MSFFDKLSETAKKAKEALDEAGVIDELGELIEQAGEQVQSAASGAEAESQRNRDEVERGGRDMSAIISTEDVAEITGLPFDSVYPHLDEEWAGAIYQCSDPSISDYFELRYGKAPDGEIYDPNGMWNFLITEVDPQIPVDGLTDGAFRSSDEVVFFWAAGDVWHTAGNLGERTGELMVSLARRAVVNLEG